MTHNAEIPIIENSFEAFDVSEFEKNVDQLSGKRTVFEDDLHIIEDHQNPGYSRVIYSEGSSFYVMKLFFENGNIKTKGVSFNNGSEYGVWYNFDESGVFLGEEDTDQGYDFQWADILQYCQDHNISLDKGYPKSGGVKSEIWKGDVGGEKAWTIRYYDFGAEEHLEVRLDGRSGKQIDVRELKVVGP
ncbi:MAG: hypothetical protein ABJN69_08145 [Hellea sp.]